mmetsp:Transcript_22612/g.74989  ORF Transcript_22612/g.74989 Transcript_22612/m.74989 type:complete len:386 (+) Transcript_22612:99-1256(+)
MGRGKEKPLKPKSAVSSASRVGGPQGTWVGVAALGVCAAVLASRLGGSPTASSSNGSEVAADSRSTAECADTEPVMCEPWHKAGLCRSPPYGSQCTRTCGRCPGDPGRRPNAPRNARCRRDNQTAAVPEGHLDELFQHSIDAFPEYSPLVLSRSPWVVQYHDFLSEVEAQAFRDVCKESFERSLAGDQLNPVRTSYQCWCNFPKCFANEHIHRVVRRINDLTGTPYDNGEDLQIVRYEPGQFYRRHHDQNTAVWTPQGPRVLTFFMYLNEVDSGGETAFPAVGGGIKVTPTKGSAILWPSTYNDQPMTADQRTVHEAMPVHEGIKFGANMWIHQFSFKTPSERGCELTYVNTVGNQPQSDEQRRLVEGLVPTASETIDGAKRPQM